MAGVFTLADADIAKGKAFTALINKFELFAAGETSDQYQGLGRIAGGKLTLKKASQKSSGGIPTQLGYHVELQVQVLPNGTNVRTAVNKIIANYSACRLTDVNGHKYTFAGTTTAAAGDIDLEVEENIDTDTGDDARKIMIYGSGYITSARFTAIYSET